MYLVMRGGPGIMKTIRPLVDDVKREVGTVRERQAREQLLQAILSAAPDVIEEDALRMRDAIYAVARAETPL